MIIAGLAGLLCGCGLLVWSHLTAHGELWNLSLPVALVSQGMLVCGALLQWDGRRQPRSQASPVTHLHVNAAEGGMQPAGVSVHFSSDTSATAPPVGDLEQQISAAMRRAVA